MSLGLLARQPGKSLRVALAESAVPRFHQALAAAAASLPDVARGLAASQPVDMAADATLNLRPDPHGMAPSAGAPARHHLVIVQPQSAVRRIALTGSLSIGRAPPCGLLLEGSEVSRAHCRIDVADEEVSVTDLNSTNGTFVDDRRVTGTELLRHGALLRIGGYAMTCEYQSAMAADATDSTQRKTAASVTLLRPRRS